MDNKKICFIGAGNMAEAMINGIINRKIFDPEDIFCIDINRNRLNFIQKAYSVNIEEEHIAESDIDVFVLAVKPGHAAAAIQRLKKHIKSKKVIISIMAGVKIEKIERLINSSKPMQIVRVMPNTPALFCEGAIAYSFNESVNITNRNFVSVILSSIGIAIEVSEVDMDAITALSGSGPAYVFYLAEALMEAGVKMGLTEEISRVLAIQTIFGAGLILKNSKEKPDVLRHKVTSEGGTTEAAIKYFKENEFKDIIIAALDKAKKRSMELSVV